MPSNYKLYRGRYNATLITSSPTLSSQLRDPHRVKETIAHSYLHALLYSIHILKMHLTASLLALVVTLPSVIAAPSGDAPTRPLMRLVKTSESDPGQWVTEQQKFDRFTSKNIGFIDITDIKVRTMYTPLSQRTPCWVTGRPDINQVHRMTKFYPFCLLPTQRLRDEL